MTDLLQLNPDKPISLPGIKCAYCGCAIGGKTSTNDHVVGRRFVPESTIGNGFNLKVKACETCNGKKAQLEDDISIITMLPDTAGRYVREDERLVRTVARKAKGAISPATRRLAAQSYNEIKARVPVGGGVSLTYSGIAMPTLEDQRVARLAFYHVQGFSFLRSYDKARQHGAWLESAKFLMLGQLTRPDWGNPRLRHFTAITREWDCINLMNMADGYFRHAMFKAPDVELWAWALEWNERLRVYGLYGEAEAKDRFAADMPAVPVDFRSGDTTNGFMFRIETPIGDDEDDLLFAAPDGLAERPFAPPHWR